jgi:peptide-N4-(N-acetyl-beta-glucosaminyl)asparagine amidase
MFNIFKPGDNTFYFPYTKDAFILYKQVTRQYKNIEILDYVRQFIPNEIAREIKNKRNKIDNIHYLKPLLNWFKNDFMVWMNKNQICNECKTPMYFQYINGNSWNLRGVENYSCVNCKSQVVFPRYGDVKKIADSRIGRCSEWSMLFGALLNSLSIETRFVHDFLDHCWNESFLMDDKWTHIDSTLEYPISLDHPEYYEKNWKKKYSFILAFSDTNVDDVTKYYSQNLDIVYKRRSKHKTNNTSNFKRVYSEI